MGSRYRRAGIVLVTAALVLVGCGGSDDSDLAAPTTTAVGITSVPPATTGPGPAPSTTTAPADGCPTVGAVPAQATANVSIPIDFDGDGTADTIRAYLAGGDWHVRGEMGGVGFHDQVVPALGTGPVAPIAAARLNPSDDAEEAWVKVGSGAYAEILTIFVFRDCELQRATLNGDPVEFGIGASLRNAVGVSCFMFDQGIEVFESQSDDGITYTGQSRLYTLDITSQPAPTLELVAGYPMPIPPGNPQDHLSRLTCPQ